MPLSVPASPLPQSGCLVFGVLALEFGVWGSLRFSTAAQDLFTENEGPHPGRALLTETKVESWDVSKQKWNLC